ncbi:stage III sporulation protein AE [Sedimentibacter sp. MB31-C6]|uniref:stage III sporulation protein AE n=1 Tax=Sedimentibacter sp. MB31-C6 TaxID=3109366 RepID=UPI002DDD562F|nr:hypothetical protein [Sedimentibacter sp. MB36-C1]WSI05651.1 hypothetical protein U8307_14555 [Sedimentibacter sp. MB36-C1]
MKRVILIVLDSVGIGELPDAAQYGDIGSNTVKNIYKNIDGFALPNLEKLGLLNIEGLKEIKKADEFDATVGRCNEKSNGKDTTTGHWEISGIVLDKPFPTYPNGFPDEIIKVVFFSVIVIFTIILKDVLSLKNMLNNDFARFKTITEDINAIFLAAMLTFGKLSILQFFQTYLNYIIGITTQFIYSFTDIITLIMISIILINNSSKLINAKLLYKFLKKGTLLILSGYIIIVVINFSVQGYILYKTDNIFISSIKALSPSSIPVVGNAVTSFFGVFLKSLLMIKDVLGIIVIIFIISAFGGSLIKMILVLIMYKSTAVIVEPFNDNISKLIYEMADIFFIYLICLITPIVITTVYYSVLLNFMNNIFG